MLFEEKDLIILKGEVQDKTLFNTAHNDVLVAELKFINLSSYTIVIAFRDGSLATLPTRKLQSYSESLIIGHKKINRTGTIHTVDGLECDRTELLRKKLLDNNGESFYWEELISIETLKEHRDGVYVPSADIVVTLQSMYDTMCGHPYAAQAIHNEYVRIGDGFNSSTDIGLVIRAIDNSGECGRLYVIVNGKIAVISPRQSVVLDNGIYVTGLPSLNTTTSNNIRRDVRYSIADGLKGSCPFKFYHTLLEAKEALHALENNILKDAVDARTHEAAIITAKRERDVLEQQLAKLKLDLLEKKTKADEQDAARERIAAQEQRQHEKECEQLKAAHAKTSGEYKLLADGIKVLGVVVTVGWSLYKIFK